ncbi:PilN domain-containing protein [Evansella sp. AB-rgal1]|uniref:PilN domain-containing protein n=1 Tax=Evansella sp. AB-rgal1 TaxID=3242696 RepID=UPI00359DB2EE
MSVEINLLPKKPKKNYIVVTAVGITYGISMVILIAGIFYYQSLQREQAQIENNIETVKQLQLIASQQAELQVETPHLDRSVTYIEDQYISSAQVVNLLANQLPTQGFFTNYQYTDGGTVQINAVFSNQREVASYLHHLQSLSVVTDVMIHSVSLIESETETRYSASYTITFDRDELTKLEENVSTVHLVGEGDNG